MCRVSVIFEYAASTAFSGEHSPIAVRLALGDLLVGRQELDRAVQFTGLAPAPR